MALKLKEELQELGSNLESPPSSKDALIKLLKHASTLVTDMDQSPPAAIMEAMQPFLKAIVKPGLLKHQDKDVKLLVASCLCEITRITAPDAPYSDEILKVVFELLVGTFSGLNDSNGPSFGRRVIILETIARYRSCVVMLDLECDDLVTEIFRTFMAVARDDHPENVLTSMETIMVLLVEESDDVQDRNLLALLSSLGRNKKDITEAARNLAMSVIRKCTAKVEPVIKQLLISSMSGDSGSSERQIDYHEVIFDLYRCSPEILSGIVPYLTGELLADQSESRIKAVRLVGELFSIPGKAIPEVFQPIFNEFLKRLTDRVVEVRMTVLDYIKNCLCSSFIRQEAPQTFALHDRLLDYDENVRKQVVTVVCDVARHALDSVPVETVKLIAERLRDKSLLVKKHTLERLGELYRLDCLRSNEGCAHEYDWIPGKILRCFYDKDFRSDTVETVLCETMFPVEFSIKDRVHQWIEILPGLDKVEVKALEKILDQKQRLQLEMQKYLTFKKTYKDSDVPDSHKKGTLFFRVLSRYFTDPEKAEENFQALDQMKDVNIWKMLSNILDPNTSFAQAKIFRDVILKTLGEKHRLSDFLNTLSVKCSYILFSREHVKEILSEVVAQKSAGSSQEVLSCMNMLVILARYSALLFVGSEDELLNLLMEDDEIIKEGILHVLAMAGGVISERLASSSISLDLILERMCLEGSRRQAKYAVHTLAAIKKNDGLLTLSVLYKKLVDMLEEKSHLPSVLQSLGCIAQTAVSVFETREKDIVESINANILLRSNKTKDKKNARWHDGSELCQLKIFGIKTLVKSYLPVKDTHLRSGIENLIEVLRNILSSGDISKEIKSSSVDRAHLRLAAAKAVLRLSRQWDHKIPADVFHLTVRTLEATQISFPSGRKIFRSKLHQYVKDRVLDPKYACALLFSISGPKQEFEECKSDLAEIIQMCHQVRARQLSKQSDASCSMPYPEFILPYLIHTLAHHPLFPGVAESTDPKLYEPIYRILYLFLSMVVHGDQAIQTDVKLAEKENENEKESISTLTSILQHIKRSVDVLDAKKSKNSYVICDIGLLIIKRLAKQPDLDHDAIYLLTLPSSMYKPTEKEDDSGAEDGDKKTWLAYDSVAAHFESFKLEANGTVPPEIDEDEIVEDDEIDGKEVPLGKLIKRTKSQKVKPRKTENDSSPAIEKNKDKDADALKVVQEINVDDLEKSSKFESSNGHDNLSVAETEDNYGQETKKRKGTDNSSESLPKRQRPSVVKSSSKRPPRNIKSPGRTFKQKSLFKEDVESADTKLLASCTQKKRKSPISSRDSDENSGSDEEIVASDEKKPSPGSQTKGGNPGKSFGGTSNKQKRRSITKLSKDLSVENGTLTTDLVDCKIKVWWPLDKKFYEGVVKSYDTQKKKHVVLYEDGDVEVLRLEKERWELIPDGGKHSKNSKPSKSPSKGGSTSKKAKASDESGSMKSNARGTAQKYTRTKNKNVKSASKGKSALPSQKAENKSDSSDSEPAPASEIDALHTGDPEVEKLDEKVGESPLPKGKEKSKSGEEKPEAMDGEENDDSSSKAAEETKPSIEGDQDETMEEIEEVSQIPAPKKSNSKKKQAEKPTKPSQKKTKNVPTPTEENKPPSSSTTHDDDNEPIINWAPKLAKPKMTKPKK